MKKNLLFIISILITINLYAYTDNDMDGVEDRVDQCPNTPLMDLADINGCSTKSLISPHRYSMIIGFNYSDSDYRSLNATDTFASSLQIDYYYKNFSLQASTSFFKTEGDDYSDSGLYDSFIGASYRINKIDKLSVSLSAGVILPTYDTALENNNMDYIASANLSYAVKNLNIFGGYSFTLINDDDVGDIVYQNSNAFNVGVGYYINSKLYMSASYSLSNSIYTGLEDIETSSIYGHYTISKNMFSTLSYAYGLSDTASNNYVSARLGYLF